MQENGKKRQKVKEKSEKKQIERIHRRGVQLYNVYSPFD